MKKIIFPSMLVISLIAFAQYTQNNNLNIDETFISQSDDQLFNDEFEFELNMEEQDEAFEFDAKDYLPFDFNPYTGLFTLEYEMAIAEEDAPFEYDTKDYLPFDFNPYSGLFTLEYEVSIEEEDAPFEFDTKKYLPFGFDPYCQSELAETFEVEIEEEDATFDFDTKMYLPENFNPYCIISNSYDIANL